MLTIVQVPAAILESTIPRATKASRKIEYAIHAGEFDHSCQAFSSDSNKLREIHDY